MSGNDRHRLLGSDPVEVPGRAGHGGQCGRQRCAAQVDRDRVVDERRVEDDVDVGELTQRRKDDADAGVAEHEVGEGGVRQLEAHRRQGACARDQRFELGLTRLPGDELGLHDLPGATERVLDLGARRVQLCRQLIFEQGLVIVGQISIPAS